MMPEDEGDVLFAPALLFGGENAKMSAHTWLSASSSATAVNLSAPFMLPKIMPPHESLVVLEALSEDAEEEEEEGGLLPSPARVLATKAMTFPPSF